MRFEAFQTASKALSSDVLEVETLKTNTIYKIKDASRVVVLSCDSCLPEHDRWSSQKGKLVYLMLRSVFEKLRRHDSLTTIPSIAHSRGMHVWATCKSGTSVSPPLTAHFVYPTWSVAVRPSLLSSIIVGGAHTTRVASERVLITIS